MAENNWLTLHKAMHLIMISQSMNFQNSLPLGMECWSIPDRPWKPLPCKYRSFMLQYLNLFQSNCVAAITDRSISSWPHSYLFRSLYVNDRSHIPFFIIFPLCLSPLWLMNQFRFPLQSPICFVFWYQNPLRPSIAWHLVHFYPQQEELKDKMSQITRLQSQPFDLKQLD